MTVKVHQPTFYRVRPLHLTLARHFVGDHVNINLRDGSVIVNVLIVDVQTYEYGDTAIVYFAHKYGKAPRYKSIRLGEVESMTKISKWKLEK